MGKQKRCNPVSRRWAYDRGANGVTDQTQSPKLGSLMPAIPVLGISVLLGAWCWWRIAWGPCFGPPVSLALTQLNGPSMGSADAITPFWLDLPACEGFDSSLWVPVF